MKNIIYLIFLLFFLSSLLYAQKTTIKVSTAEEFVNAIGSDREIELAGGVYILSGVSPYKEFSDCRFVPVYDGFELQINKVKNLLIKNKKNEKVKILTNPKYGYVLSFVDCENIVIENIEAGHGPEKGYCTGGVFNFLNCMSIVLNNNELFGSGTEGITAIKVTDLIINNSEIKDCSYSIMTLDSVSNVSINNCEFKNNREFDMINLTNSQDIMLNNCSIKNNSSENTSYSDYCLFNVLLSKNIILNNCEIKNNSLDYFCSQAGVLVLNNTELKNNTFTKGKYKL